MISKKKACLPDDRLNFLAEADLRRESISSVGNLKKGSCHKSFTLWRKGLNGLSFDSQSLESGSVKRERKCSLLMHASIPTVYFLSPWFSFQYFFLFSDFSVYSSIFILSFLPLPSPLYCSWLPFFIPSTIVGFTLFSLNCFWLLMGIPQGLPTSLPAT